MLSADVSGPLKVPGLDADARGVHPKPHKYLFVAKLKVPKTFLDDGRGVGLEYDPGELEADLPPDENAFDYEEKEIHASADEVPEVEDKDDDNAVQEEDSDEPAPERLTPEEDIDLTGPDTANLPPFRITRVQQSWRPSKMWLRTVGH